MAWKNAEGDLYPYSVYERIERTLSAWQMLSLEFLLIVGGCSLLVVAVFFPYRHELAASAAYQEKYQCEVTQYAMSGKISVPAAVVCAKPTRRKMSFKEMNWHAYREAGLSE